MLALEIAPTARFFVGTKGSTTEVAAAKVTLFQTAHALLKTNLPRSKGFKETRFKTAAVLSQLDGLWSATGRPVAARLESSLTEALTAAGLIEKLALRTESVYDGSLNFGSLQIKSGEMAVVSLASREPFPGQRQLFTFSLFDFDIKQGLGQIIGPLGRPILAKFKLADGTIRVESSIFEETSLQNAELVAVLNVHPRNATSEPRELNSLSVKDVAVFRKVKEADEVILEKLFMHAADPENINKATAQVIKTNMQQLSRKIQFFMNSKDIIEREYGQWLAEEVFQLAQLWEQKNVDHYLERFDAPAVELLPSPKQVERPILNNLDQARIDSIRDNLEDLLSAPNWKKLSRQVESLYTLINESVDYLDVSDRKRLFINDVRNAIRVLYKLKTLKSEEGDGRYQQEVKDRIDAIHALFEN